jgi:hypothetical protein
MDKVDSNQEISGSFIIYRRREMNGMSMYSQIKEIEKRVEESDYDHEKERVLRDITDTENNLLCVIHRLFKTKH